MKLVNGCCAVNTAYIPRIGFGTEVAHKHVNDTAGKRWNLYMQIEVHFIMANATTTRAVPMKKKIIL